MKTTIDISDPLLEQAKRLAARQGTSVKALAEMGLRRVIADKRRDASFRFQPVTDVLPHQASDQPPLSWEEVRDIIYERRGT